MEKPARYSGGEVGILAKRDEPLRTLIAFPDLYEIGMGNQAVKIIYNNMNGINGISCDRAFAPAPDFEKLLRENNIPLYGLDTGISLACLDILMFTLGYELGLNGALTMLDVSGIPLRSEKRGDGSPILIAGGPAVSNPLPFSPFIDAFWIGEAEAGFFDLARELAELKKRGQGRAALLEKITQNKNIWVKGKERAYRAVFAGFSQSAETAVYPVPSMKIVQNHGAVEIMRGCPNGCRFCHAGFWYRPMRQKSGEKIAFGVNEMVTKGGWQEISLSSLSSGDYNGISGLVENLNNSFRHLHVSFQLPSLKVTGFSLDLLEKISVTRKSSLTFAVETPHDACQMAINKEVTRDSVVSILNEAKRRGWSKAKFYFMIGLPIPETEKSEEEEIVSFIADLARRTRMRFNINIGIFIPKPHTPYQRAAQIDSETAERKFSFLRSKLKPMGHKVSVSDPLISRIEGLLSRGDEDAGLICEQAFLGGSRLDAWDEFIKKNIWLEVLEKNREKKESFFSLENKLSWQTIDSRVTDEYLLTETEKSAGKKRTPSCKEKCGVCGVCGKDIKLVENRDISDIRPSVNHTENMVYKNEENKEGKKPDPSIFRILFKFCKKESAVFHGHLSLIEIFSMSFRRASIPVLYTLGFNPLAKIEFASPLTTGIGADGEIASADFAQEIDIDNFLSALNDALPNGIRIEETAGFVIKSGVKKYSLASLLWGFAYDGGGKTDYINAASEKSYRQNRLEKNCPSLFSMKRLEVLARNITEDKTREWISYFDAYKFLYN